MQERDRVALFERMVTPHIGTAYSLARWLTRNDEDAEDVVQEACVRAFRSLHGFRGADSRAWVLAIVRNTAYSWLQRNRRHEVTVPLDDRLDDACSDGNHPELQVMREVDQQALAKALDELPLEFREVIILREMEDLSYREIASIAGLPIGTVMSRLARARKRLQQRLTAERELHCDL